MGCYGLCGVGFWCVVVGCKNGFYVWLFGNGRSSLVVSGVFSFGVIGVISWGGLVVFLLEVFWWWSGLWNFLCC